MDLLAYLRILRRRWALVLAAVVVGAGLGAGSAVIDSSSSGAAGGYHKATHVLLFETDGSESSGFQNMDQAAYLTTSADVRDRVEERLGKDGRELAEHILIRSNLVTSTIEITAASGDARESEAIADAFAEELLASLGAREQTRYETERDRVVARLDQVQAEIDALDAQLVDSSLPNRDIIEAQRDGLVNQYRLEYEEFQQLADRGAPGPPLSTLEIAEAVPINAAEYEERLRRGQLGEQVTRVDGTVDETDESSDEFAPGGSTFEGPVSRGVLGALLGLLAGVGLALVAERLDQRLRSRQEVEVAFGAPVLAEVPVLTRAQRRDWEVASSTLPLSRAAEAHRAVRSAVLFQHGRRDLPAHGDAHGGGNGTDANFLAPDDPRAHGPLVVLVTSASSNEGKTTTTANLAAVFAESGASVLAVNCDFRRPTLHRYLGAADEPRRALSTAIPGVTLVSGVLTDPAANPALVVAAQREVIAAAREHYDVVLLDTAPLLTTNDAIEIVPSVDAVLVIARPNVTTTEGAHRAREMLERVNAPVVGVVVVADDSVSSDSYYYYSSRRASDAATGTKRPTAGKLASTGAADGELFPAKAGGTRRQKSTTQPT